MIYYLQRNTNLNSFPHSSVGKESACNTGDPGSIPGSGRSPGGDRLPTPVFLGFPSGSAGKESTCNVGDLGFIPGLGRSPGGRNGYPLQYPGLENSMDCIVFGVPKGQTRLCDSLSLSYNVSLLLRPKSNDLLGLSKLAAAKL